MPHLPGERKFILIPIDPFYLAWRARKVGFTTRFIELAGEINAGMPGYVVERTREALTAWGTRLSGAGILLLGVTYKRDDMRMVAADWQGNTGIEIDLSF